MSREMILVTIHQLENKIQTWKTQNQAYHCDDQIKAQNIEKIHAAKLEISGLDEELEELDYEDFGSDDDDSDEYNLPESLDHEDTPHLPDDEHFNECLNK